MPMALGIAVLRGLEKKPFSKRIVAGISLALISFAVMVVDIQRSIKQEDPAAYAAKILVLRSRRIAELAASIEAISFQFFMNRLLNTTLSAYVNDAERYDISKWNTVFSQHMEGLAQTVPEIEDAIFFAIPDPNKIPLMMTDSLTRATYQPVRSIIMQKAIAASGKSVWDVCMGASESAAQNVNKLLVCARLITNIDTHVPLGVLVLLVNPDRIARAVSGSSWDEDANAAPKTDYTLLIDENSKILVSASLSQIGLQAQAQVPGFSEHFPLNKAASPSGKYKARALSGAKATQGLFWVIYERVPDRLWTLVSILPVSVDPLPLFFRIFIIAGFAASVWLILSVLRGGEATPDQSQPPAQHLEAIPDWFKALAPREKVVMVLLLKGLSNKEIAYHLAIREQTVKNYLHGIYKKLGVQDRFSALLLMQNAHLNIETIKDYAEKNPSEFSVSIDILA